MSAQGHIFLAGFMGSGKSSVGRVLAKEIGRPHIEMDREIERTERRTIAEIFAKDGEAYFRDLESAFLRDLPAAPAAVISCGGGVPLREENRARMHELGVVVLLAVSPETAFLRAGGDARRPNITMHKDPESLAALMEARRPAYEAAADLTVQTDGRSIRQICAEITQQLTAIRRNKR